MKGFETTFINVKSNIQTAPLIQAVKGDYHGMRVYYTGDELFYRFDDFSEALGFKLRPNPEIRYFLNDGTEVIEYRVIAMQIMLYIEAKEVDMADNNKKKIEMLRDSYNAYCNHPIEAVNNGENGYVVVKKKR